jgi:hypothetical protein
MKKQARRLWFGDWRQDDEEPAGATDSVRLIPEEDPDPQPRQPQAQRPSDVGRRVAVFAAVAVGVGLAFALISGGNDKQPTAESQQIPPAQVPQFQAPQTPQVPQGAPQQGFGGPDLTGSDAAKAAAAALDKFPGDVERVTAGPNGGGYVVHVFQADGNEVHVLVNDQFKVEGSDAGSGGPQNNFGPGTSQ